MANKDTSIISVRVNSELKRKLEQESELKSITLNTLVSQVLGKHVAWDRFAEQLGFVFITKQFLRAILEHVDEKTVTTVAVSTCRGAMRDAILFLEGDIHITSFLNALDLWFGASHMPFRHITNNGIDKYIIQHELGKKWSLYVSTVINAMLSEIGYHTRNQILDEQTVTFEIAKVK